MQSSKTQLKLNDQNYIHSASFKSKCLLFENNNNYIKKISYFPLSMSEMGKFGKKNYLFSNFSLKKMIRESKFF